MTKPIDLPTLIEQYHNEDACRELLEDLRWPDGIACPRCAGTTISRIAARHFFDCDGCRYQFSVKSGTVMQDSKLPHWKWFLATYLIVQSKKGISSKQLQRMLGSTYRTAWHLSHRIRWAMGQVPQAPLTGTVEADETFVGGRRRNYSLDEYGRRHKGRRPGDPKIVVLGALQRDGQVRLRKAPNRGKAALRAFLKESVADEAVAVYTDEWGPYTHIIADENTRHETVNHSKEEWVRGDVHTNGMENVWSLFKRAVNGTYHQLSGKHLDAYLDEIAWKFNNRDNPHIFRDTLSALVTADPLEYRDLVATRAPVASPSSGV